MQPLTFSTETKKIFCSSTTTPLTHFFNSGDKIASNIIAQTVGVPTLPWSGSDLIAPMLHPSGKPEGSKKRAKVSRDLYRKGCANTLEEGLSSSQKIGYPVMIKASEGGGGKGIRKVESAEEFPKQYAQVSLAPFSFLALFGPFTESAQWYVGMKLVKYFQHLISNIHR